MRTSFTEDEVDDTTKEQIEAEHAKWEADLRLFKGSLMVDQQLIQKTEVGSWALHDILEWNDAEHGRSQGLIGKSLVHQLTDIHVPKQWHPVGAMSLVQLPPSCSTSIARRGLLRTCPASWPLSTSTHLMHETP